MAFEVTLLKGFLSDSPPISSVFFSELTGQLLSLEGIPDCSGKTTGHEVCTRKLRHFYCNESFSHVYTFPEMVG